MNQALIVLCKGYDEDGGIDTETIMRLKEAIKHFGEVDCIILPGYEKQTQLMKAWILKNSQTTLPIYTLLAYDTIGQAVFSMPLINALQIKTLLIVTSDYHLKRTHTIFEKIYLNYCELSFFCSSYILENPDLISKDEEESLELFLNNFGYATNYFDYMAILFHQHPRYRHINFFAANPDKYSSDAYHIWEWRNDPITRLNSRIGNLILFEEHQNWYERTLNDPKKVILMAFLNGIPEGMVRFDLLSLTSAEISININPMMRGKGLGSAILIDACQYGRSTLKLSEITAEIKPENTSSIKIFEKAGFDFQGLIDGMRKYSKKT